MFLGYYRLGCMLVFLGGVDLWRPFGAGTLKHKVWISLRISPVECSTRWTWWKTHSSFSMSSPRLFSILEHRALVHTFDAVPSISPALLFTPPYAHTSKLSVCLFLWNVGIPELIGVMCFGGGMLTKLLCICWVKRRKCSGLKFWVIFFNSNSFF